MESEGHYRAAGLPMKINEQPRDERLAHARTRRCDDGDGMAERHRLACSSFRGRSRSLPSVRALRGLVGERPAVTKLLAGGLAHVAFHLRRDQVDQLHAVVLGPDIAEPVPDIAAQHERIIGRLAGLSLFYKIGKAHL